MSGQNSDLVFWCDEEHLQGPSDIVSPSGCSLVLRGEERGLAARGVNSQKYSKPIPFFVPFYRYMHDIV